MMNDEQLGIIRHMLLKSPPGELYVVLKEIKDILEGTAIPSEFLETFLKEYNLTNHALFDISNDNKPVIFIGSLNDKSNEYHDSLNSRSYVFDHLNNTVVKSIDYSQQASSSNSCEELRHSILPHINKYIADRFCKRSAGYIGCDGEHMDICIVGEIVKLSSYYTGRWVGQYSLDIVNDSIHMTGVVDIQSHYYENGNVQMSVHKELSPLSITLDDKAAVKVIQEISSFEDSLQTHLKEVFSSMQKDALKDFRRQLPRTRQHFQWNVNAHRMADTMKELQK